MSGCAYCCFNCALFICLLLIFCQFYICDGNIIFTYLLILASIAFYIRIIASKKNQWTNERRRVDSAEINALASEIERYQKPSDESFLNIAKEEYKKIECKAYPANANSNLSGLFELDILGLRNALVDLYPYHELEAKCHTELRNLQEYSAESDVDYDVVDERIKTLLNKASESNCENKEPYNYEIRAEIKEIRSQIAFLEKTWAEGEAISDQHLYISIGLIVGCFLIGILPLIHPAAGNGESLELLHWAFLGITGGIFSSLLDRHQEGYTEIGETAGKRILRSTLSGLIIGGVTSILLYSGLKTGIIAGSAFPKTGYNGEIDWGNCGMAIFWGLFSGISMKIYSKLVRIAEGRMGGEG